MIREAIDWVAGLIGDLKGCDPDAPATDACKADARKKAVLIVILLIIIVIVILYLLVRKYVLKPLSAK